LQTEPTRTEGTQPRPKRTSRSFARSARQVHRARELRQAATEAEDCAWNLLRDLRQKGFLFRRQQPVEKWIVDFCCLRQRLIIELDGSVHAQPSQEARDVRRDQRLQALGYRVARFPNGFVLDAPEEFIQRVLRLLSEPI
jgi:very-short-patch-repair endonuclease